MASLYDYAQALLQHFCAFIILTVADLGLRIIMHEVFFPKAELSII